MNSPCLERLQYSACAYFFASSLKPQAASQWFNVSRINMYMLWIKKLLGKLPTLLWWWESFLAQKSRQRFILKTLCTVTVQNIKKETYCSPRVLIDRHGLSIYNFSSFSRFPTTYKYNPVLILHHIRCDTVWPTRNFVFMTCHHHLLCSVIHNECDITFLFPSHRKAAHILMQVCYSNFQINLGPHIVIC